MASCFQEYSLKEIKTSRTSRGYYKRGNLLSIDDIYLHLSANKKTLKAAGQSMKSNIESVIFDMFLHVPLEFPVCTLQHVTSQEGAKKILDSKSFKGREHERPEFNALSFWSAEVSLDNIQMGRLQVYKKMKTVVKAEDFATFCKEMMEQFANSPAFDKSASRYGNFKFSFPLSDLLSRYKTQHCKGREPQLRILGTDVYKQEIAHYILVHSPDTIDFIDLPMVSNKPNSQDVVSWIDETLYWRPESTSNSLSLKIFGNSCTARCSDLQKPRRSTSRPRTWRKARTFLPRCVWNHLMLCFHLPNDGELKTPVQDLLSNLTPCHPLQPFLNNDPIQRNQAKELIQRFKKSSRDYRTQVSPKRKNYEKNLRK
ncbi:uncharacterized protein LOC122934119 [Bufo gargarizans]|uniref:uncharacterized protein LOC122934119 n=1 Tax=Bufo gargarizans TaxID=30331 RepID=UPI001CF56CA5|nr:uncharacterized protein LOC122934119 [Bufo gargarizans]